MLIKILSYNGSRPESINVILLFPLNGLNNNDINNIVKMKLIKQLNCY